MDGDKLYNTRPVHIKGLDKYDYYDKSLIGRETKLIVNNSFCVDIRYKSNIYYSYRMSGYSVFRRCLILYGNNIFTFIDNKPFPNLYTLTKSERLFLSDNIKELKSLERKRKIKKVLDR